MRSRDFIEEAKFIERSGTYQELCSFLEACISEKSATALVATQFLAIEDYGGFTMKHEFKQAASACLLAWGKQGLDALVDFQRAKSTFSNYTTVIRLLSLLSSGSYPQLFLPVDLQNHLLNIIPPIEEISLSAEILLNRIIIDIEDEDDAISYASAVLQTLTIFQEPGTRGASSKLIAALASRTLTVGGPVIDSYDDLLRSYPGDEPRIQKFLELHPLLLDPLATHVWPQPDLHGYKKPDFIIQRADGSYLVVEIETPGKGLITSSNQLSAETTHAVAQALDYRDFLQSRFETASQTFPEFRLPDAMVVIGMEGGLPAAQRAALRRENEGRSYLRIVGFDMLASRARAILNNLTQGRVPVVRTRLK
ncbi:Shedu anti-phage system protein SduA domain-containing protein [Cupriavidus pauculus]|uniref:Shedu anti-phage system protein SduA domain-containing protein n=1 Tax=Cupriavidus pauculus TaxID=82633 RepID=UPI001EE1A4E8|nr:Shedu anti-phage system protein SduA domain-containing protein [Cupriavidus pauculus]GJG93514.1 hypothetical protein CBA19C6_03515 [Cupriavidus pauculus]